MPKSISKREQKLVICKLALDLLRLNYEYAFPSEPFGARAMDGLLMTAVFVGFAEGKPMPAGKLAAYAGVPRSTADRRLRALQREGYVQRDADGCYLLCPQPFENERFASVISASVRMIIRAGAALSKMDT